MKEEKYSPKAPGNSGPRKPNQGGTGAAKESTRNTGFPDNDIDRERHAEEQVYRDEDWGKEPKKKTA